MPISGRHRGRFILLEFRCKFCNLIRSKVARYYPREYIMAWIEKYSPRLAVLLEDGTAIALVMALVAMFGAIAAWRAGDAEEQLDVLESKLSQRHLIELNLRKEYNEREGQLLHFDNDYRSLITEGRRLRGEADALRKVDAAGAARRDVQAEVEFNAARILKPYRNITWIDGADDKTLKGPQLVDKNVARDLQDIGFGTRWTAAGESKRVATSLWHGLQDEIDKVRKKLFWLSIAVVLFVAGLGCLTYAELWRHKLRRMQVMIGVGFLVTASGLILAIYNDLVSAWAFAGVVLLFVVCGFVGAWAAPKISEIAKWVSLRMGFLRPEEIEETSEEEETSKEKEDGEISHPGELEPRLFPGVRLHAEHTKRAFSILVILLIVFTVLLSAIIGTAYSRASMEASGAASVAADHLVDGFRNSQTYLAYSLLSQLAATQQERLRFQAVLQEANLTETGALKINTEELDEEKARWGTAVNSEGQDVVGFLYGNNGNGPEFDTRYPRGFLNGMPKWDSYFAYAEADAANELSVKYHTEAERYLTMLTWLAIALYLFGQSLTMTRELNAASMLVVFGVVLVASVLGIGLTQIAKAIPGKSFTESQACRNPDSKATEISADSEAARQYADGRTRYDTANTQEDYANAVTEFKCAVEARPSFSLANFYLSRASKHEKSPQNGESFTSLFSEDSIKEEVDRESKAMESFDREGIGLNPDLLGNLGWDTYSLGLVKKDPKLIKEGLKETNDAVKRDSEKGLPFLRFNLGVIELAAGNLSGAKDAYKDALAMAPVSSLQDGLALASINDLEIFLHYCHGFPDAVDCKQVLDLTDNLKQQVVAAAWPIPADASQSSASSARIQNLWLFATPAGLGWHGKIENFSDARDVLTVVWYKYEEKLDLWRALPDLSGKVDFGNTQKDSEGNAREFRSYLDATSQQDCAQNGAYRAEFYLNGKLVNLQPQPHISINSSPFSAAIFRDLNVSLCHPEEWNQRWRSSKVNQFMAGGYTNKEFSKGVFAFEYYFPRVNFNEAVKKDFALLSMNYLAAGKIQFQVANNEQNPCPMYPVDQTIVRMKSENDGIEALARIWSSSEGIVHVGVALQKKQLADGATVDVLGTQSQGCNALRSIHEISVPY